MGEPIGKTLTVRRTPITGLLALTMLLVGGCNTYKASFAQSYQYGQYEIAEAQLLQEGSGALKSEGNGDRLIYLLEQGAVQRTRGDLAGSTQALDLADDYFKKVDEQADIRIGRGAKAAVSNLAELAYEGYGYDRIMMNAYKALNYMEQGNLDYARAELKRVAYTQQQLERTKAERIKKLQEEGAESGRYNSAAATDPGLASQTRMLYSDIPDNSVSAAYVNGFAEYLQGIFLLHAGDSDDREVGRAAIRRTLSMINNAYVRQDFEWAEKSGTEQAAAPVTYVIFESGLAPLRKEVRIDIPVWFFNLAFSDTGVDYIGVAFPRLIPQPGGMPMLQAQAGGAAYPTQMLVDMDGVVAREFKDELPTVITRTIIAAGAKAGVAFAANRATKDEPLLNLLTRIATTAYQYTVNNADLRTWRTLPKTISVARFPTPADGRVTLLSPAGAVVANVTVIAGAVNVIWVRGPGDAGGIVCRTFGLGAKAKVVGNGVVSGS